MTPKCPDCKRDQDECICKDEIASLRAEVESLHTKLAQFTKWNSELTAKCNWYNCDGARLEREIEIEALKQQVEQGKRDAERWNWWKKEGKAYPMRDDDNNLVICSIPITLSGSGKLTTVQEAIDAMIAAAPQPEAIRSGAWKEFKK